MGSAVLSPCGKYRYRLDRDCLEPLPDCILNNGEFHPLAGKVIAFFGINPSTADASINDPTVRKWIGFCRRWGVSRFIVGNLFAYRSTNPKELTRQDDPFGPEWLDYIRAITAEADVLVPCWGRLEKMPKDLRGAPAQFMRTLLGSGKPVMHFGVTGCKQPMHPLMLGYSTPLTPWGSPP